MSRSDQPVVDADPPATGTAAQPSRWWVAAITFVAGVVVGVLAVGLLSVGKPDFVQAADSGATPRTGAPQPSDVPTAGVKGQAVVNLACLRVINEAQDVYTILAGVDQVVRDVDLQQLDDMVRRLQPVEPRLQQDLQDCRVDTSVQAGPTATSPAPAPASTR